MLKTDCSKTEVELAHAITLRAEDELAAADPSWPLTANRGRALMDIIVTHCNGCPLDLEAFLKMPRDEFAHDFYGIRDNLNRRTGQLENLFLPRCAKVQHG